MPTKAAQINASQILMHLPDAISRSSTNHSKYNPVHQRPRTRDVNKLVHDHDSSAVDELESRCIFLSEDATDPYHKAVDNLLGRLSRVDYKAYLIGSSECITE